MFLEYLSNIWRSTTFRLGLWVMALFSVSFLILGGFVYWQTLSFMEQELRSSIEALSESDTNLRVREVALKALDVLNQSTAKAELVDVGRRDA